MEDNGECTIICGDDMYRHVTGNYCTRSQQGVLDNIAAQLTEDNNLGPDNPCTAPVIESTSYGSGNCGNFKIKLDDAGNVNYLFVHHETCDHDDCSLRFLEAH